MTHDKLTKILIPLQAAHEYGIGWRFATDAAERAHLETKMLARLKTAAENAGLIQVAERAT